MQQFYESTPPTCAIEVFTPIDGDNFISRLIVEQATVKDATVSVNCGSCEQERLLGSDTTVVPVCFYLAARARQQH